MAYQVIKPAYELTVRDFFVHFPAAVGVDGDKGLDLQLPVVKTLTVTPNESNKTIYASGIVYDVVSTVRDSEVGLNTVALPRAFLDRALGALAAGGVSVDLAHPIKEEFGCGYFCDNSDGSQTYYYHPRCKLLQTGNRQHQTSNDSDPDPAVEYGLRLMPTDESVWRVRYYTSGVAEGKVPLTPAEFFELHPATLEEILAIPDAEKQAADTLQAAAKAAGG